MFIVYRLQWQQQRTAANALPTDRTFTGQEQDGTGLMYYRARFYDPALGTFVSPDTMVPNVSNVESHNRYMYVLGNPLKFADPTGHKEAECLNGESCTGYQTPSQGRGTAHPANSGACTSVICLSTPTPTPSINLSSMFGNTPTPNAQIGPRQYSVGPNVTGDIDQGVGDVLVHKEVRSNDFRASAFGIRLTGNFPAVAPDLAGGGYGQTTITKTWQYANGTYVLISDEVDLATFTASMTRKVIVSTDVGGYRTGRQRLGTAPAYSQGQSDRPVGYWIPSEYGNPVMVTIELAPVMPPKYLLIPPYVDRYSVSLR